MTRGVTATSFSKDFKPITVRRTVERRILRFSLCIGAISTVLAATVYVTATLYGPRNPNEINNKALSEFKCEDTTCDPSGFIADPYSDPPDYVINTDTLYLLMGPGSSPETEHRLPMLDFVDLNFVRQFNQPTSYVAPDGERWRLFSLAVATPAKELEIIVGYAEKQSDNLVEAQPAQIPKIDEGLRREADRIAANLKRMGSTSGRQIKAASKFSADGFTAYGARQL